MLNSNVGNIMCGGLSVIKPLLHIAYLGSFVIPSFLIHLKMLLYILNSDLDYFQILY